MEKRFTQMAGLYLPPMTEENIRAYLDQINQDDRSFGKKCLLAILAILIILSGLFTLSLLALPHLPKWAKWVGGFF